jgi:exodeoxyribonuclease III
MTIITWNVNGIRAVIKKGFGEFLKKEKPDVLCLQETKIGDSAREKEQFSARGGPAFGWDFPNYEEYWNAAERPGYSGTAILISDKLKVKSEKIKNGMNFDKFDIEGRVQTAEFPDFYLVNAYFPNSNHELSRLEYKMEFNESMLEYLRKLGKKKPFILCGDLNVAHQEIDLARPRENVGNAGFTYEERAWLDKIVKLGYYDVLRYYYPEKVQYTWWSYRARAREKNIGWRIDYFISSPGLIKKVKKIEIMDRVMGSDHCPVKLVL